MREAHAHIPAHGHALATPRLDDCPSLETCLDRVARLASSVPSGAWLRLTNARPESWPEARWPTASELDRAAPDHPCAIMSFDFHSLGANTAALARAGITPSSTFPDEGTVVLDPSNGRPTGLLLEAAAYAVWSAAPEPTPDQHRAALRTALSDFARLGYDEVHDLLTPRWLPPMLAELERERALPVRVALYPHADHLEELASERERWSSDLVRLAGGKLFADGTLNSRSALVLHPYRLPAPGVPPTGQPMASQAKIEDAVRLCESLGLHLATHAIGDAAVRLVLDAIESASARARGTRPVGHRIEHCELIDEADLPRFARMGVVCSVQPCHLLTDIEVLTRQLPHRLDRVLPLRELIDSGCAPLGNARDGLLWFGSDAPVVRPNHEDSLQAAIHRRRPDMPEDQAIAPAQAISRSEAIACFGLEPGAQ